MGKNRIIYPDNKKDAIMVFSYNEIDNEGKIKFQIPYMKNKTFSVNVKDKIPENGVVKLNGYGLEYDDNKRGTLYLKFVKENTTSRTIEGKTLYGVLVNGKEIILKKNNLIQKKENLEKQYNLMKKKEEEVEVSFYYFPFIVSLVISIWSVFAINLLCGIFLFFIVAFLAELVTKKVCGKKINRKKEKFHCENVKPIEVELIEIDKEISILEKDKINIWLKKEFNAEYLTLDAIDYFIDCLCMDSNLSKEQLIHKYETQMREIYKSKQTLQTENNMYDNELRMSEHSVDLVWNYSRESNYRYFCEIRFAELLEKVVYQMSLQHIYTVLTPDINNEYLEVIARDYLIESDEQILFSFSYSGCMKEGFVLSTSGITYKYSSAHGGTPTFIPYKDITKVYVEKYLLNKVLAIEMGDFKMPDKLFLIGMECIFDFERIMKEYINQIQTVRRNPSLLDDLLD